MVKTHKYETIFVIDVEKGEEQIASLVEKFKNLISKSGEIVKVDDWGKRRLAYPINYKTEGYYVLVEFTSQADFPAELSRQFKITDGIIRYIVINQDER
jgi:small subunit ribosomal protein S6